MRPSCLSHGAVGTLAQAVQSAEDMDRFPHSYHKIRRLMQDAQKPEEFSILIDYFRQKEIVLNEKARKQLAVLHRLRLNRLGGIMAKRVYDRYVYQASRMSEFVRTYEMNRKVAIVEQSKSNV